MATTYYLSKLKCPSCNAIITEKDSTDLSNNLISEPGAHQVRKGESLDVSITDIADTYYLVNQPEENTPIHTLETWHCPKCRSWNWARILFNEGKIEDIYSVDFSAKEAEGLHYISYFLSDWLDYKYGKMEHLDYSEPINVKLMFNYESTPKSH